MHIAQEISEIVESRLLEIHNTGTMDIETSWIHFKTTVMDAGKAKLKNDKLIISKKKWMTTEILNLMETRRKYKNRDEKAYKEVNKEVRKEIRRAKSEWFSNECREIEELEKKYNSLHLHKKVKELAGVKRNSNSNSGLADREGNIILDIDQKLIRWKEYVTELFTDERNVEHEVTNAVTGPSITTEEVERAIKNAKNRKATGPDEIPAEMLKLLEGKGKKLLLQLFNAIYNTGIIPNDWLQSTFITIPKKTNAKNCSDHRTISLMSHVLKIFLSIIHQRIYHKIEDHIGDTQFGFRKGLGTREALFSIEVLVQRSRDVNSDVFLCFIDFEKAFDRVRHEKMIEVLRTTGIDDKDLRIIANLYWQQKAVIRVGERSTEEIEIRRGVRQGCILSPLIFNLYSEKIFDEAVQQAQEGIVINGVTLNNLRYADDTVLMADSLEGLIRLLHSVTEACSLSGLTLNTKKTKYMIISKQQIIDTGIQVNGIQLERVKKFTYLGHTLDEQWDHTVEIRCRIERARAAFNQMKRILCGHDLNLSLRIRLVRCYVFSVLLYGVESWTLTEAALKKLQAFEMWVYRRMLKISWMDHVRNEDVMRRMNKDLEVVPNIKIRKLQYFGHVMRHPEKYGTLHLIMQGKINSKRGPGRRRTLWLGNLGQWFGKTSTELFRAAVNKIIIANMIANVR